MLADADRKVIAGYVRASPRGGPPALKLPPGEYAAALAEPGVTAFAPDGGRPMGTWLVVPAERVADDPDLAAWVARGLRAVRGG